MLRLVGAAGMGGVIAAACSTTTTSQPTQSSPYFAGASSYPHGSLVGVASWYGPGFDGKRTANGEIYNQEDLTAASPSLPLGSRVMVTNLDNGRSVEVRINDRGPFVGGRKIDLSHRAAQ